ncbi:MAG TPA: DsbA family protein [Rhodospirillaceae bacterium]|nr:DsbA family protein [Rhodospirillaceae bacterium]
MLLRSLVILLFAGFMAAHPVAAIAEEEQALTPKQQDAVRKLVHDYLLENPSVISEAIEALRQKEELAAEMDAKKALADRKDEIFSDPQTPVLGNKKGDVSVVEFFDYRCTYCKSMLDMLFDTVKADGKVRLVMKEFPILGPDSVVAARAALAAKSQNKYEELHKVLMRMKGPMTEQTIMKAAAEAGLNVEKLKKDMEDSSIDTTLKNNVHLAHALNLTGTPGFIVGDQLVGGAMSPQALKQLIDQARKPKG